MIIKIIKYILKPILKDLTFFGGLIFYLFLIVFFFSLNQIILSLKLFIGLIFAYFITIIIRSIYYKKRPNNQKFTNFVEKLDSSSFPSLHSIRISLIFFLIIKYYDQILISLLFLSILIVVSLSRYLLKKHYLVDIFAGLILGYILSLIINIF